MVTNKALWLVTAKGGPSAVVRAACPTCARSVMVDAAGPEGTRVWREADVQRVHESGRSGVVLRT